MDRTRALIATAALAAAGCSTGSAGTTADRAAAPPMRVGCSEIIDRTRQPFAGGYRRVLDVLAVPPAHIIQVVRNDDPRWPFWEKSGMVVRASRMPIDIRVPASWRNRAAITWGNGRPAATKIRFAPCASPAGVWNAYAGGFLMKARGACIPLVFEVGGERRVVHFGVAIRCGNARS
jgi:hypothetical protein